MGIKVFAIVRRADYDHLRRLIPGLPQDFAAWVESRYAERRAYDDHKHASSRIEQINPADFAADCINECRNPTLKRLDDWATITRWLS